MSGDEEYSSDCSFTTPNWDSDASFDTPPTSPVPSSSRHTPDMASTSELNHLGSFNVLAVVSKTIQHLFSKLTVTEKDTNRRPIKDDDVSFERIIGMPLWKPPKGFYQINRSSTLDHSSEAGSMPYTYDKALDPLRSFPKRKKPPFDSCWSVPEEDLQCDDDYEQDEDPPCEEFLEILKIRERLLELILTENEVVAEMFTSIEITSGARILKQNMCNKWCRLFIRGTREAVDEARRIIQEKLERMVMQSGNLHQLDDILDLWWIGFPLKESRTHVFDPTVATIIKHVDVCTQMYRVPCPLNSPQYQETMDKLNCDLVLEIVTLTSPGFFNMKPQQVMHIAKSTNTIIHPTFCEEPSFYIIGSEDMVRKSKGQLIRTIGTRAEEHMLLSLQNAMRGRNVNYF